MLKHIVKYVSAEARDWSDVRKGKEPRNSGSFWRLKRAEKQIFLSEPPEATSPADTLIVVQ